MGGCQNYDTFWGTLNIRRRIKTGIQKGTITLTTTHVDSKPKQLVELDAVLRPGGDWAA